MRRTVRPVLEVMQAGDCAPGRDSAPEHSHTITAVRH